MNLQCVLYRMLTEYHIHHKAASTKKDMSANEKIFEENNRNGVIKCPEGIDQYL